MPLEIILSIFAAFLVGTSDFLVKMRGAKSHILYALLSMSGLGTLFFGLYGYMSGQNIFHIHDIQTVSLLAIGGVLNMFALLCLYLGIARGPVSVAAPLVSLSTIFLAVQWYFMGVTLSFNGYIGASIALLGAVMLGFKIKNDSYNLKHILITAGLGLLAGLFFAIRLFIFQLISDNIHHSIVLTQARFFGLSFILITIGFFVLKRKNIFPTKQNFHFKSDIIYPTLQAFLGSFGMILLLIASTDHYKVIAPTIFTINAGFTILWSSIIFKEKISIQRIISFVIIIIGISILKIYH